MSEQKYYRLIQPLFSWEKHLEESKKLRELILTYDIIYNLLFTPEDMQPADIRTNAEAVLGLLGSRIEKALGSEMFIHEIPEETQLSFNLDGEQSGN